MLTNEKKEQLKMFFLNQSTNFEFLSDKPIILFDIISKILQDPAINMLFCKIIFPDLRKVTVFYRRWIEEVLQEFLLSEQCKEIFELQTIQTINGEVACIKLMPKLLEQGQFKLLEMVVKNIIKENAYPISMIKSEIENILNHDQQLKIYLKPILFRLIAKNKNFEEKISLMPGDLVRFLRKIKSLDSWRDSSSGEIYFVLTHLKPLYDNQQPTILSAYLQHNKYTEHQQNNNSFVDYSFTEKQDSGSRLRCFST